MGRLASAGLTLMLSGLVVMALALAIFPTVTGTKAVTITTNSMQDTMPLGSLVYIQKQTTYQTGDVVTFPWNGNHVTHQLYAQAISPANGKPDPERWVTKGTSNQEPDPWTVTAQDIEGKALYFMPFAGTALKVLSYPVVWAFLGLVALGLYLLSNQKGNPNMTMVKDDADRDDADLRKDDDSMKSEILTATMAEDKDAAADVEVGAVPATHDFDAASANPA